MMKVKPFVIITIGLVLILGISFGIYLRINSNPILENPNPDSFISNSENTNSNAVDVQLLLKDNEICNLDCQDQIIKKISIDFRALTDSDIRAIVENAADFKTLLVTAPNNLAALLRSLENEDHDRIRPAALAIMGMMSQQDHLAVSSTLLRHTDPNFRVIGIRLLDKLDAQDETSQSLFNTLISSEENPRVLVAAIHTIANPKNGTHFAPALDTILSRQESDFVWGTTLLTKARLLPTQSKYDVQKALSQPSDKMRRYGLQALSILANHHAKTVGDAPFTSDPLFAAHLNDIMNDPDMNPDVAEWAFDLSSGD